MDKEKVIQARDKLRKAFDDAMDDDFEEDYYSVSYKRLGLVIDAMSVVLRLLDEALREGKA